jgi:2-keto-4-pentenoate hydratase/2-oxohepta-3-ene-1,7-dioic acid hydratase in catechol pathway
MRLIRFKSTDGPRLGLQIEGSNTLDLSQALQMFFSAQGKEESPCLRDVVTLAEAGLLNVEGLRRILDFVREKGMESGLVLNEKPRLLAPAARPGKIIGLGLNYAGHARESGREPPAEPIFFQKSSSAIIGPEEPVGYPSGAGRVDPEVELAVIIGRRAKAVPPAEAMNCVGGYTVLNDMTAREMQSQDIANRLPWYRSKSMDTFCPMGPAIVLTDEIENPGLLRLEMRVNGEVRQKANTADLIFGVPFLIHYISRHITLEPGDVIATGTPEGIAPVKPGDIMEAWVEKIGTLRNPVVEE